MSETVVVAVLALLGTLTGSMAGIMTANRLVNFRLERLEEKVNLHNRLVERTYQLESRVEALQESLRGGR